MERLIQTITDLLGSDIWRASWRSAVVLVVGLLLAYLLPRLVSFKRMHAQHRLVVRRLTKYAVLVLTLGWILREFGVNLGVLVGAAGVITVAVGFASQTSASNLISGLFLMGEQPFVVGDVVRVAETTGEVVSIDLLSVKLRTFDNLLVRIPNETMLKANVTNLTHFPLRRLDMLIGVAYKEDIKRVREILLAVADENPICMTDPPPLLIFIGFGDSSLDLQFSVWAAKDNYLALRNTMYEAVKEAFDAHGVEIPFPHRTLYAGSVTAPLPVRLLGPEAPYGPDRSTEE